ncbi:MAG: hypothetical protein ABH879_06285 [archaeon]
MQDKAVSALSFIGKDELIKALDEILTALRDNHNISEEEALRLLREKQSKYSVPVEIFASGLSVLEALVKYVKETYDLNYHEIGGLIERDERSVWAAYQTGIIRQKGPFKIRESRIGIPVNIFTKQYSLLESIIIYLKEVEHLRNIQIAKLLSKRSSTIWTCYTRAMQKRK